MSTLLALADTIASNPMIIAQSSEGLVTTIREFVGPILMLVTGIAAISFLYQRQLTQFIVFAVLAVAIFAIFYAPQILANLGTSLGRNNSQW